MDTRHVARPVRVAAYVLTILLVSMFAQGAQTDGIVSVASRDS